MKCPHCNKDISGSPCPQCGFSNPESAHYCMECGTTLRQAESENNPVDVDEEELDFENRILCPDGTCTGIIVDGKCTECGKEGG